MNKKIFKNNIFIYFKTNMKYECIECMFMTELKSNYIRHLTTKKHYNNMETKKQQHL